MGEMIGRLGWNFWKGRANRGVSVRVRREATATSLDLRFWKYRGIVVWKK